jgi:hypothetical protein
MPKLLQKPIPKEAGTLRLTIMRNNSGFNRLYPKYSLLLADSGEFILNAKRRAGNKLSNYLISSKEGEFERKKESFMAKLRACTSKSMYTIYDSGENFQKNVNISRNNIRNELGWV